MKLIPKKIRLINEIAKYRKPDKKIYEINFKIYSGNIAKYILERYANKKNEDNEQKINELCKLFFNTLKKDIKEHRFYDLETSAIPLLKEFPSFRNYIELIKLLAKQSNYSLDFKKVLNNLNLEMIEDALFHTKTSNLLVEYAIMFNDSIDVEYYQRIVSTYGDIYDVIRFAKKVKGVDIKKLENRVIKRFNGLEIFLFARDIEESDTKKLEDAVISKIDSQALVEFARSIEGANIERLEKRLLELKNNDAIFDFYLTIKSTNPTRLENYILNNFNKKEIEQYFETIKKEEKNRICAKLIETKNKHCGLFYLQNKFTINYDNEVKIREVILDKLKKQIFMSEADKKLYKYCRMPMFNKKPNNKDESNIK